MSLLKNEIKFLRSLQQKKYRDQAGIFVAEGPKIVGELLAQSRYEVAAVYGLESWVSEQEHSELVQLITTKELERISGQSNPNEVLATIKIPGDNLALTDCEPVLLLDGISDPGNLGTILRTADWFGIRDVIASIDSAEMYNPKVVQSSMGSIFRVNYQRLNLEQVISDLETNGYSIYLAQMSGCPLNEVRFDRKTAIVLGSESHGIRKIEGKSLTISSFGESESLNVSIACGILLHELRAQLN
jgi:RNA methyltransferase, TrmH family